MIDFSWFYFIGLTRLGLTIREIGHLSVRLFMRLYGHYQTTWSREMKLTQANMTYAEFNKKQQEAEDWF